jgi:transmembrane sensor
MKKPPIPKLNRQILEEASEWFVDFRVGDADATARAHFDEWLRRSPEHIRAYWEIAKTYVELPDQSDFGKLDVAALIAYARSDDNVVPLNAGTQPNRPHGMAAVDASGQAQAAELAEMPVPYRLPRRRLAAAAAACALLASAAGGLLWHTNRFPTYSTDIGERRSLTLADGSAVDLNARSSIRIEFSNAERRVELLHGQALFQVAKDKHRPFIVRTADASVRAIGTQFDVYRKAAGTTVTVLEGEVAVYSTARQDMNQSGSAFPPPGSLTTPSALDSAERRANHPFGTPQSFNPSGATTTIASVPTGLLDPSGSAAILLSAGEQVTVTPQLAVPAPQHADITATTAWMQHRLIFDGTRLADVVEEFNRYNRRQLVVDEGSLSEFHVSGVYSSTDPTSLLRFLQDQPGVKITESESEIRIAAK